MRHWQHLSNQLYDYQTKEILVNFNFFAIFVGCGHGCDLGRELPGHVFDKNQGSEK